MATKKPSVKKRASRKPITGKKVAATNVQYSQLTWVLMFVWLGLVALFLALIVVKLYLNN